MASDRFIFQIIEQAIIESNMVEIYPYNERLDYLVGDIVECSYIKGFFEVVKSEKDYIKLKCINDYDNIHFLIGKAFLKKTKIDKIILRTLYAN